MEKTLDLIITTANSKAICNKGFIQNSIILPHSNFGLGGQESSPQSLTAYSRKTLWPSFLKCNQFQKIA